MTAPKDPNNIQRTKRAKTGPTAAEALEHRKQILTLRMTGATLDQIAQQVGRDKSNICRGLKKAFAEYHETLADMTKQVAAVELARLDRALLAIWPQVTAGHLGAIDRFLGISKRRADMLGLDAPKKASFTDPTGEIPMPLAGPAQVVYFMPDNGRGQPQGPADDEAGAGATPPATSD